MLYQSNLSETNSFRKGLKRELSLVLLIKEDLQENPRKARMKSRYENDLLSKTTKCSICNKLGHNKRWCPVDKKRRGPTSGGRGSSRGKGSTTGGGFVDDGDSVGVSQAVGPTCVADGGSIGGSIADD